MKFQPSTIGLMPVLVSILLGCSLIGYFTLFPARFSDFRAFYCAGRSIVAAQDPYREHPLHECEHGLSSRLLSPLDRDITIPAPYPGYALAVFAIVAQLPFDAAVIIWTLASSLALIASIILLARSTAVPVPAMAIVLGLPATIIPLPLGQPTIFVLLAIAACAALVKSGRPQLAALAAWPTAIDPHVGLAVGLGLFVGAPRTRPVLIAGIVALAGLSTLMTGLAREWEYVHDVLPLHALVNVAEFSQFSTANLAFTVGLAPPAALTLGNWWYAGSLIAGVLTAVRLRSRFGLVALALIPVAFAVFGGAHTHLQQLALATPAFMLITSSATGRLRALYVVATFVASLPWLIAAPFPYLFFAASVCACAFARLMRVPKISALFGASVLVLLVVLCFAVVYSNEKPPKLHIAVAGNPLAEIAWGAFVNASFVPPQPWFLAAKLPTIGAFATMLFALLNAARGQRTLALRAAYSDEHSSY